MPLTQTRPKSIDLSDRRSVAAPEGTSPKVAAQHPLWLSVLLHLLPGAAVSVFVVLVTPALETRGADSLLALLLAIGIVLAPLEIGYLSFYSRRTTGSWSPMQAVDYRNRLSGRQLVKLAIGPAAFMLVLVGLSMAFLDRWLADSVFPWVPDALRDMATAANDDGTAASGAIALLVVAFVFNGVVGPLAEEMYFRGHLLPRISRFGRFAPVLGTALFTLYHFHSPWRYPAIFLGFLPITWLAWRKRSIWVSLTAHMIVNNVFILMMLAAYLGSS